MHKHKKNFIILINIMLVIAFCLVIYKIFKTYEVVPSDLSPVFEFEYNSKELTLITCNNLNSNRLIVKSKQI